MRQQTAPGAGAAPSAAPSAPTPPAAPAPPGQPATIVIPTTGGEGDITINVDERGIHVQQGTKWATLPIGDVVPRGAVQIAWTIPATLAILLVFWPLTRGITAWLRRKTVVANDTAALEARLRDRFELIERNVDTVAIELERMAEGQRFTNKLLSERPVGVAAADASSAPRG